MPKNTVYESHEYERLVKRGFKLYSEGHRRMYLTAIERIGTKSSIFEAGFGIGYGLQQMEAGGILGTYFGVEPNGPSFNYVDQTLGLGGQRNIRLQLTEFNQSVADAIIAGRDGAPFDEVFCIEVVEHIPLHLHLQTFIALRQMGKRLWFSSPDKAKSKEGVRSTKDWGVLLKQAKFTSIDVDTTNWTHLFECR